jgi:hypothetical protein
MVLPPATGAETVQKDACFAEIRRESASRQRKRNKTSGYTVKIL